MAYTKEKIIQAMESTGMIPVFYHADITIAKQLVDAAYAGGVRVFEFTNRGANAFEVFTHLLTYIQHRYPDAMLGIGTIMNAADTLKYIKTGAHFIVSPILKLEMAGVCHEYDILWIPGCATLTEIVTAHEAGAGVIKIFPGSVLGPGFVSAVKPVVPALKLMPTGGVEPTEKNLTEWFEAGVVCVGMGSQLFTKDILANNQWDKLQADVAAALKIITGVKSH